MPWRESSRGDSSEYILFHSAADGVVGLRRRVNSVATGVGAESESTGS